MALTLTEAVARLRTPEGQKMFRYSVASVVAVVVSLALLVLFDGILGWGPVVSSTLATGLAAIPSYGLNRWWAWGLTGKSRLWREVVPFWVVAFIGWAFSTYCVDLTHSALAGSSMSHSVKTALDAAVYLAAFGVLWVAKFLFFNRILFVARQPA